MEEAFLKEVVNHATATVQGDLPYTGVISIEDLTAVVEAIADAALTAFAASIDPEKEEENEEKLREVIGEIGLAVGVASQALAGETSEVEGIDLPIDSDVITTLIQGLLKEGYAVFKMKVV